MKKIVIAGGSGFVGRALAKHLSESFQVVILSRTATQESGNIKTVQWNAKTESNWTNELEGCFAVINLTGRNVNCRYTAENKKEILESRTQSTGLLATVIGRLIAPPEVWIQASSATIYRHARDKAMDEDFGETGNDFSMNVVKAWEKALNDVDLPKTRKVIMRMSIVMGRGEGAFPRLINLVKFGLGGRQGNGLQMVSWIHIEDVVAIVDWFLNNSVNGVFNVTAPEPVSNSSMMQVIRDVYGRSVGLPAPAWLLSIGAMIIGTETELILKSRWVVPTRLLREGYTFRFPSIKSAMKQLIS